MGTEVKPILLDAIICAVIIFVGYSYQGQDTKTADITAATTEVVSTAEDETRNPRPSVTDKETTEPQEIEPTTVKKEVIEEQEDSTPTGSIDSSVPNNTIKSYMDYRCITLTTSRQYKLQHSLAYTGDYGIRMVNGRYCVAVGSYYTTTIGQYIDIELENGSIIHGILADCKDDKHTDSTNRVNPNGSVVEFVVDVYSLDSAAKRMGDISYVNGWNSKVVNIKVLDTIENF